MNKLKNNIIFNNKNNLLNYIIYNIAQDEDVDLMLPYSNEEKCAYMKVLNNITDLIFKNVLNFQKQIEIRMMQIASNTIDRQEYIKLIEEERKIFKQKLINETELQILYYEGCKNGFKKGFESSLSLQNTIGSFFNVCNG